MAGPNDTKGKQRTVEGTAARHAVVQRWSKASMRGLVDGAIYAPLVAAVWAPVSTLMDIPGLTQPWHLSNGANFPDPKACLVLSSFSLFFNVLANVLLVLRFTVRDQYWKRASTASCACWVIKVIIALVNLGVFGPRNTDVPMHSYSQGFWAAVVSVVLSGLITIVLLLHYCLRFDKPSETGADIRVAGIDFMMSVVAFVSVLALEALIFSRIEHWTFMDGIYYATVTAFTIGFGDYSPTHVATRILCFPFAVLSIALLTVQVGTLVSFISKRAENRKAMWREHFESRYLQQDAYKSKHPEQGSDEPVRSLVQELHQISEMEKAEERMSKMFDALVATGSLIVFWVIGGAIFMALEGWAFGTALYFAYIAFLTIGYGDFSPATPAGKVVFVVYALLAVPVVTNFVVQTVTGILSAVATKAVEDQRDKKAPTDSEAAPFFSHAHIVEDYAKNLDQELHKRMGGDPKLEATSAKEDFRRESQEKELVKLVLELAVQMENQARNLLLDTLEPGSKERRLLRADQNVQERALLLLKEGGKDRDSKETIAQDPEMDDKGKGKGGAVKAVENADEDVRRDYDKDQRNALQDERSRERGDPLEQCRKYRETYAALLAAGSRLLQLEGDSKWEFEKRLKDDHEHDEGGFLLGSGRRGAAEEKLGVDV